MKIKVSDLKKIIQEENLKGIPEFAFQQATDRFVEEIEKQIERFILLNKSANATDQRQAMKDAAVVLDELKEEVTALLENKLWQFLQNV